MTTPTQIQLRRGLFANLPTLLAGEPGFTLDTHQLYVGDGSTNHLISSQTSPPNCIISGRLTVANVTYPVPNTDFPAATSLYFVPFRGNLLTYLHPSFGELSTTFTSFTCHPTVTYICEVSNLSDVIQQIPYSTAKLLVGSRVSGAGIPALATITAILSSTSIRISAPATASSFTSLTFTFPPNSNIDIFLAYDTTSASLDIFPFLWTNNTTRAFNLSLYNGYYVHPSYNNTYRYLGTVRTTANYGEIADDIKHRYVWNYYNRVPRTLFSSPAGATQPASASVYGVIGSDASLPLYLVVGVSYEEAIEIELHAVVRFTTSTYRLGIGINSTTVPSIFSLLYYSLATSYIQSPASPSINYILTQGYNYLAPIAMGPTTAGYILGTTNFSFHTIIHG